MLTRSFVHLPGIGKDTERKLWARGILTWEDLLSEAGSVFKNPRRATEISRALAESQRAWKARNYFHFYQSLPRNELWRLALGHGNTRFAFLDIETTGLWGDSEVTTITVLMDGKLHQAHDRKLKRKLVHRLRDEADVVVSYFGERFDIPFLERSFNLKLNVAQIDLCPLLRRHGHTGGLKGVEKQFKGLPKRKARDIHGFLAPVLWEMYQGGDRKALDALLLYNAEDTTVLQPLLEHAIRYERDCRPHVVIPDLNLPAVPRVNGRVEPRVMKELKRRTYGDVFA
jgi:uncharacterized protein YprB with RNaseH-like and TPR domain